jgi:ABC-type Mn2+/Zn2+ transport system ATPase subunit
VKSENSPRFMKIELNNPVFLPHCGCQITLDLVPGQGLLLVGENGIGKSTLLFNVHKILGPEITAFLPQKELEFFSDRKLGTLKKIFLESQPPQLDIEIFQKLWSDFQLSSREDRNLSQLSGGEGQALKICLTLSKKAEYFLLDEPFQFLDKTRRDVLLKFIKELPHNSKTVVLIEHQFDLSDKNWQIGEITNDEGVLRLRQKWTI